MDDYFYKKVWAPNGQMFEVTHEKAAQLVLNKGWSNTPPATKKPANKGTKAGKAPAAMKTVDAVEEVTEGPLNAVLNDG